MLNEGACLYTQVYEHAEEKKEVGVGRASNAIRLMVLKSLTLKCIKGCSPIMYSSSPQTFKNQNEH